MASRQHAQITILLALSIGVVFYYLHTSQLLEQFYEKSMEVMAKQGRKPIVEEHVEIDPNKTESAPANETTPVVNQTLAHEIELQRAKRDKFVEKMLKTMEGYVEWTPTDTNLTPKEIIALVTDKVHTHLGRVPEYGMHELEKLEHDVRNYTYDLLGLKTIPPHLRKYFTYFKPEINYLNTISQEHPFVVEHIKKNLWIPSPPKDKPYNLWDPNAKDRSEGQLAVFLEVFNNKIGGTFIECGGLDGEEFSNTVDLEQRYNWTGVLIEASPISFGKLQNKIRKCAIVPACLSLSKFPSTVEFAQMHGQGKIANAGVPLGPYTVHGPQVQVHCLPFYSFYLAMEQKEIDVFILDIEGLEVDVLQTIPFDKVNIHTFMIEFINGKKYDRNYMRKFMEKQNYRLYNGTKSTNWIKQNDFFIKKGSKYDSKNW